MQTAKCQDFRLFLHEELTARCTRNPSYSLRSFAKLLEISPSALSAILNGKRPLTNKMKYRLGIKLGIALEQLKNFKANHHGNRKFTDIVDQNEFQQITIDKFAILSEPYHYSLLEIIKTKNFRWDSKWIARRLNLTVSEVNIIIERLQRVGLLSRDEKGILFDTTKGFSTDIRDGLTTESQMRFQQRSLEQSITALQLTPIALRDNTSMTMAINTSDLPEARRMLKEFRRRFCKKLESAEDLNEVYQLTLSFIPVTNFLMGEES